MTYQFFLINYSSWKTNNANINADINIDFNINADIKIDFNSNVNIDININSNNNNSNT